MLDRLLDRVSIGTLSEPAPSGEVLDRVLQTMLRAPDHGHLTPWRFLLIRGDARAALADVVAAALRTRDPEATEAMVEKQRGKFLRAPLVVALGGHVRPEHKIPEIEQVMSVAAGVMNLLNGFHTEGFGAIWVTGANAYDPAVLAALGIAAPDLLAGFLFVGTPTGPVPAARRAAIAGHVQEWTGTPVAW